MTDAPDIYVEATTQVVVRCISCDPQVIYEAPFGVSFDQMSTLVKRHRKIHKERGCFCCTCEHSKDGFFLQWNAACHLHGAHGRRGCAEHDVAPVNCDCGCGFKVITDEQQV